MSKITGLTIQEKNKNRCNIFIDGDFFMGLPIDLVYKNSLKVGDEVDTVFLENLLAEKEYLEALSKATDYVSKYLKTKKQVKTYLLNKGYNDKIIYQVIDKLVEYNFINDKEYAKRYIEGNCNKQGANLLKYNLMMKGLKKEDILSIYDESEIDSKQIAKDIAQKKIKNRELTKENLSKVYRYIISKGFSYEDANFAINSIKQGE